MVASIPPARNKRKTIELGVRQTPGDWPMRHFVWGAPLPKMPEGPEVSDTPLEDALAHLEYIINRDDCSFAIEWYAREAGLLILDVLRQNSEVKK